MTIEQGSAYIGGSVVNSLAQQKVLSLRQREADAYWKGVAEKRQNAETSKKKRAARLGGTTKAAKQDFKHQEEMEFRKIRDEAIMQFISLEGILDPEEEKNRLRKKIAETEQWIEQILKKVENPSFAEKAPKEILEKEKEKLADAKKLLVSYQTQLASF